MFKHETFSAFLAIGSMYRTQTMDQLMTEMNVISMAYEQQNMVK